jgi:hypothetical protein
LDVLRRREIAVIVERIMWNTAWQEPRLAGWSSRRERQLACAGCERKLDREHLDAAGRRTELTKRAGRLLCPHCARRRSAAAGAKTGCG